MEEAFVSFLIERLGDAVIQEVAFFKGVHGQFERLKKELVSINSFLKDADKKRCDVSGVHTWVADVRDLAYDVDDIIDLFFLKVASKEGSNLFRQYAQVPKKLLNSYGIGKEFESLFARIEEIDQRRRRYGIKISTDNRDDASSSTNNEIRLRRSYPGTEDDNIIGLEEDTNSLVEELMKEGERLRVVSICGMGGLGKTTLAKRVYNHSSIKSHFDCHAWTFISQQCRVGDVLQDILRQVSGVSTGERGKMSEPEMMEKLSTILMKKRYLVVLDDIWNKEAWDMLKPVFPHGRNGSKVMLTSRHLDVAEYVDRWGYNFEPRKMNEDEGWDLILKIVSPRDDLGRSWHLSSDMEKCGRQMVKKCGGLPLAIIVLGGILAGKNTLWQWETVSKDIGQARVSTVLGLSYSDLPFHLKPLFLFLGLYPEDYHIPVRKVIKMWIAEGMVISSGGRQTLEEVGEQYVQELIQRSMIQVGSRYQSGKVKTCQLHDLMRDFIIRKAREENFFQVVGNDTVPSNDISSLPMATSKLRRCAMYLGKERYAFSEPGIRTVLFFEGKTFDESCRFEIAYKDFKPCRFEIAYKDFKRVRVLNFWDYSGVSISEILQICKLTNLRYLALGEVWGIKLPKSIGNLVFLETLDLRRCDGMRIPNVIWKLIRLRHLYLGYVKVGLYVTVVGGGLRLDTLKELQTLSGDGKEWRVGDLVKLSNLQKLKAEVSTTDKVDVLVDSVVDGLDNLRSLSLHMIELEEFPDLERLSLNRSLLKLKLYGKMTSFPSNWPSNLVKLKLMGTSIREDPMPTLEKLQHLRDLSISDSYSNGSTYKRMVCSSDGFPQLQHLRLDFLRELEEWVVEKGAMSCLTTLQIILCRRLKKMPEGLKFLTQLKKLRLIRMPSSFEERVKEGGEDWQIVQHIPAITFNDFENWKKLQM